MVWLHQRNLDDFGAQVTKNKKIMGVYMKDPWDFPMVSRKAFLSITPAVLGRERAIAKVFRNR